MDVNSRRAFLGLLGSGAVGGAVTYTLFSEDKQTNDRPQQERETPTTTDSNERLSRYEQALKSAPESINLEAPRQPQISFDYEPIRVNIGDSEPLLARVEAVPIDGRPADTIRVFPDGELELAADYFTSLLGTTVGRETFVLDGEERVFAQGSGPVPFFLWAGKVGQKAQIHVGRGKTQDDAKAAVRAFKRSDG